MIFNREILETVVIYDLPAEIFLRQRGLLLMVIYVIKIICDQIYFCNLL